MRTIDVQHQLSQRLILLGSLLLCVIGTSELLYSADDTEQSSSEKTTANSETENNTTDRTIIFVNSVLMATST